ncbi:MAG: tripartite tricarboxylate transporter permease [Marinosulfonomonas sp.]|nr:tripartite tricarboxylate transporter permease [Marinosulfonomonas sp.]
MVNDLAQSGLLTGLYTALSVKTIFYAFVGVSLGTLVGVLPGVGSLATIALLMPLTFYLDPVTGIVMLAGIYYGGAYGGSTASILLNLPGTANTAVTCLDGYPMTQQGRGGVALFITTIASFVGSTVGIIMLAIFALPLASIALKFGPQEYFALMMLGLIAASSMTSGSPFKSLFMTIFGVVLGLVGTDVITGVTRFTMGVATLFEGLPLVAVALGLFGLGELMRNAGSEFKSTVMAKDITFRSMMPTKQDWKRSGTAIFRGTWLGAFFGTLPGTGSTISSFMSYALERRVAKHPEEFGRGAIEGVSGPEAANNSAILTAFIPTLTLGVPGDAVMALMLGVFMIHGISPGPQFITANPEMFWTLVFSFFVGNVILLVLNIPLIGVWVRVLTIPYSILFPAIVGFLCIGVYSVNNSVIDLLILVVFGVAGYGMYLLRMPIAPLILGLILGPLLEENFRRAMVLSRGDIYASFGRPIAGTILAICFLLLCWMLYSALRRRRYNKNRKAT